MRKRLNPQILFYPFVTSSRWSLSAQPSLSMASVLPSLAATALPTWLTYDMTTTAATTTVPPMTSGVPTWPCPWWRGPQHILFQLANLCFGLSFLTPAHIKYHPWLLRTIVSLGALLLHVWGATVVCHPDVVTWYILFLVINLAHLAFMTYRTYPFQFSPQYTAIYNKHFAPFNVSSWWRHQMEALFALLDLRVGNSPVTGEFPSQSANNTDVDVSLMCIRISC